MARQYCGQFGELGTCQVAVSLSEATWQGIPPIAYRLQLPEEWARDRARRPKLSVPEPSYRPQGSPDGPTSP